MKKLSLFVLVSLLSLSVANAQNVGVDFDSIPGNTIVFAPLNSNLFGTYNNLYYKRKLGGNSQFLVALRVGLGLSRRFFREEELDLSNRDEQGGYNFNIGVECSRKLGNFSLSFGPELSYTRVLFGEGIAYDIEEASIFSPTVFEEDRNSGVQSARYRLVSPLVFIGVKYHISKHFQVGIESAYGLGYIKLENEVENTQGFDLDYTGRISELAVGRQLVLECNF